MSKKAVILFNLGGPDSNQAVKPFLFNLFSDKAIIDLPNPFRFLLARLISSRRAPIAMEIYEHLGGKSPILEETESQKKLLEEKLNSKNEDEYKVFVVMRYWRPFAKDVVGDVKKYNPDEVILLPLYPQFSTATSESSIKEWNDNAKKAGLTAPVKTICCYPQQKDFIDSHVNLLKKACEKLSDIKNSRILFSAHGLPKRVIDKGDPYQYQINLTAESIMKKMDIDIDWNVCYQSKVGRLEWIGPSTDSEIERAAKDGVAIIIIPIAFVSEHSETLVELDIEYKELADNKGVKEYIRVATLSADSCFIKSLADICLNSGEVGKICANDNSRICPKQFGRCIADN